MPPTRRQPAQEAAPPSPPTGGKPLEGCKIALKGGFRRTGHTQTSLEDLVRKLGGSITATVAKSTTHLVCTQEYYSSNYAKVREAMAANIKVIGPLWILDCQGEDTAPDPDKKKYNASLPFIKTDVKTNDTTGAASKTDSNGTTNGAAPRGRKRKVDDQDSDSQLKKAEPNTKAKAKAKVKDEEKEDKIVAEGQFMKKKDTIIPVDEGCPYTDRTVYIDPQSGMIWDAALNQSHSTNNNNKFYRVQILYQAQTQMYHTWTRWGRVGERGQSALLGIGSLTDAVQNFQKKFKDKSGLTWENRADEPKPGKYAFIERSYDDSDSEDDAEDTKAVKKEEDDDVLIECTLEKPIQDLMTLIFNQQYFQATMSALNYDANKLPLGKLSKATITRGFQQLKDLAALMDDQTLAHSKWQMMYHEAMEHLSNTYYSSIPHAFGRNRPPIISDSTMLKREIELLESLSDMKDASDIMKVDRKTKDTIHALDSQFQGLKLQEMTTLSHKSTEFDLLSRYLNTSRGSTHNINYKVDQIWRIERTGETNRFESSPYAKIPSDRRLLWHGSRCTNFGGILSQGLRIAPPEAPVSGYMFGKGIYLADMSSKSAGYCCHHISNGHALLLLCEAELGDPMQELINSSYSAGKDAKKNGMHSTLGMGNVGPTEWMDGEVVHPSLKGIKMPDTDSAPGPTNAKGANLHYNEYICYDVAQVKLRYLFRVKI